MEITCPNCNALYDSKRKACPNCKTQFVDLTKIDFDSEEPIFIKAKAKLENGNDAIITQKVIPHIGKVVMNSKDVDCLLNNESVEIKCSTQIIFTSVVDDKNNVKTKL